MLKFIIDSEPFTLQQKASVLSEDNSLIATLQLTRPNLVNEVRAYINFLKEENDEEIKIFVANHNALDERIVEGLQEIAAVELI